MKKMVKYALIGLPLLPVAAIGYAGYKAYRWAKENPKTALAVTLVAGTYWYCGTDRGKQTFEKASAEVKNVLTITHDKKVKELEQRVQESQLALRQKDATINELEKTPRVQPTQPTPPAQTTYLPSPAPRVEQPPQYTPFSPTIEPPRKEAHTTPATTQQVEQYCYVFANVGDTLSGIAKRATGKGANYKLLAKENGLANPNDIIAGQAIRIPRRLLTCDCAFNAVPEKSIRLPGTVSLSEYLQSASAAEHVLAYNRQLGIAYKDVFVATQGARIVYLP